MAHGVLYVFMCCVLQFYHVSRVRINDDDDDDDEMLCHFRSSLLQTAFSIVLFSHSEYTVPNHLKFR